MHFTLFFIQILIFCADPDSGGLEHGAVQRDGLHLALRRSLLCSSHDIWKLRALQFTGRHPGRGFPG